MAAGTDFVAAGGRQPQRVHDARGALARMSDGESPGRGLVQLNVASAGPVARLAGDAQLGDLGLVPPAATLRILHGARVVAVEAGIIPGHVAVGPEVVKLRGEEGAVAVHPALFADEVEHREARVGAVGLAM